jgi:hypothetical protein
MHLLTSHTIKLGSLLFPNRPVPLLRPRATASIAVICENGYKEGGRGADETYGHHLTCRLLAVCF